MLLIYCLMYYPLFVGVLCLSLFCYALLCVHSTFAIILKRKRKLFALLLLSYRCIITINVLWLFLALPWAGLQCVIVVFPDHAHLLNDILSRIKYTDKGYCLKHFYGRFKYNIPIEIRYIDQSHYLNRFYGRLKHENDILKCYK